MAAGKSQKNEPHESAEKPEPGDALPGQDVFDVRKVRRLVELMQQFDLSQMDLRQGTQRIQLRRGTQPPAEAVAQPVAPQAAAAAAVDKPAVPAAAAASEESQLVLIRSPMVGTFYAASDPEAPPYVKVGDHIGTETTVCIVEAMKVFNEIPAEVSGKVVAVLVKNGAPVEYGQPLFRIDPQG
jgi:acetyl-CoA carboxylase biotin carboxyl carrier protein